MKKWVTQLDHKCAKEKPVEKAANKLMKAGGMSTSPTDGKSPGLTLGPRLMDQRHVSNEPKPNPRSRETHR